MQSTPPLQLDEHHEAQEQVSFADRILISKSDLVAVDEISALRSRLVQMNPRAQIALAQHGDAPLRLFSTSTVLSSMQS